MPKRKNSAGTPSTPEPIVSEPNNTPAEPETSANTQKTVNKKSSSGAAKTTRKPSKTAQASEASTETMKASETSPAPELQEISPPATAEIAETALVKSSKRQSKKQAPQVEAPATPATPEVNETPAASGEQVTAQPASKKAAPRKKKTAEPETPSEPNPIEEFRVPEDMDLERLTRSVTDSGITAADFDARAIDTDLPQVTLPSEVSEDPAPAKPAQKGKKKAAPQPEAESAKPASKSKKRSASDLTPEVPATLPEVIADLPALVVPEAEATPALSVEPKPTKARKGRKTATVTTDAPEETPAPQETAPEVQPELPVVQLPEVALETLTETVAADSKPAKKGRGKKAATPSSEVTPASETPVLATEPVEAEPLVQSPEVQSTETVIAEGVADVAPLEAPAKPARKGKKTAKAEPAPEVVEAAPVAEVQAETTPKVTAAPETTVPAEPEQSTALAPKKGNNRRKKTAPATEPEQVQEVTPEPVVNAEVQTETSATEASPEETPSVVAPAKPARKGRGKKAAPAETVQEEQPVAAEEQVQDAPEPVVAQQDAHTVSDPSKPSIPSTPSSPDLPQYAYLNRKHEPGSGAKTSNKPQAQAAPKAPRGKGPKTPEKAETALEAQDAANQDPKVVLLEFMKQKRRTFHVRDLERALPRVVKNVLGNRRNMESLLEELTEEEKLVRIRRRVYAYPEDTNLVKGRFQSSSSGFGFVIPENGKEDYFIPADATLGAWTGDTVQIKAEEKRKNENSPRGVVVRIVERGNTQLIGTLDERKGNQVLIPDDTRLAKSIPLLSEGLENVPFGSRLVAELHWPENTREPYARVKEVLGTEITPETETRAVIAQYDLRDEFPIEVEKESEKISTRITKKMLEGRLDLRDKNIFTVDGRDAKDFDDAIHIERLENGNFQLGIHIADVSYYVTEGSALDKEAYQRATSVYLPGRVLPMLPEKLSNGVCSLVPDKDRLTLSALVEIGPDMDILAYSITPSVIHSKARLTYDEVQAYSEGTASLPDHARHLEGDMHLLLKITHKMRQRRLRDGSLDFKLSEVKVEVDKEGRLELIPIREETARGMIEDLMLLANKVVAQYMIEQNIPALYRVHEDPSDDRWTELRHMLTKMGLQADEKPTPQNYQALLKQVRGTPKETVVNHLLLRSLKQAKYAQHNLGHFGLAFSEYLHFTSPIRRYPDLLVHRMLRKHLQQELSGPEKERIHDKLAGMGDHTSERERAASDAERELTKYYQCLWAEGQLGEVFDGTISSVTSFGFFVSIQNGIEGLVHISTLPDYYIFFEDTMSLKGKNNGQSFQLGDKRQVQIANVNLAARQIDFILWENDMDQKPRARKRGEMQTNTRTNAPKPASQSQNSGQGGRKRRVVTLERSKNEYSRPVNVTVQKLYFGDWTVENLREDEPQQPRRDFRGGGNNRPPQGRNNPQQGQQNRNGGRAPQGQQNGGQKPQQGQQNRDGGNGQRNNERNERNDRDRNPQAAQGQSQQNQQGQQNRGNNRGRNQQNRDNRGQQRTESPIPMQKPRPQRPMQAPQKPQQAQSQPAPAEQSKPEPQQAAKNDAQRRRRRKPRTNGKNTEGSGSEE